VALAREILLCMSQENVELVRLAVEAYQRRDGEALRAISHEEGEVFTLTEGETEGEPFRGHAGIDEWLEHELDPWETFRVGRAERRDGIRLRVPRRQDPPDARLPRLEAGTRRSGQMNIPAPLRVPQAMPSEAGA
jgi:hypothetical protein